MDSYPHEGLETHPAATVLVVDDEPAIREVIATLLEDEGYLVRHAKDGLEALDTINDDQIDLIVSDVVMPRLDGMQVVLMSAVYADVDLPGVRFVPKPFEIDRLLGTVASALRSA
jgi:FixJ family two-component response regulator